MLVTIGFFSFSGSKLPGYVLPIFPAMAMLIGLELERWCQPVIERRTKVLAALTAAFIAAVGIAAIFVSQRELGVAPRNALLIGAITIGGAALHLALWFWRGGKLATMILPFSLIVVVAAATHWVFPALGNRESLRPLAMTARLAANGEERLVFFVNDDQGINFYATELPWRDTRSELITLTSDANVALMAAASPTKSILVASRKRWVAGLLTSEQLVTETLGEQNFNARCSPDCDWVLLRVWRKQ